MAKRKQIPFTLSRSEERSSAQISKRTLKDGTTLVGHTIDLTTVKPPERTYYAKECWAEFQQGVITVRFAQKIRGTETLRSVIGINMPPAAAQQMIETYRGMKNPTADEIAERVGIVREETLEIPGEAEQTIELSANIMGMAISGHESTLDFYKVSPFSVLKLQSGRGLDLDPQVRVDLRTSLLMALMEDLDQLSKQFPVASLPPKADD